MVRTHGQVKKLWSYLWMPSSLHQNSHERRGKTRTKRVKVYGQTHMLFMINQQDQWFKFSSGIGPASVRDRVSNIFQRITRQKAELTKESLTFAFALVCAPAHAGPKSGSSEDPTYETWFGRVSPSRVKWQVCVTHRRGPTGVDNGVFWRAIIIRTRRRAHWTSQPGGRDVDTRAGC